MHGQLRHVFVCEPFTPSSRSRVRSDRHAWLTALKRLPPPPAAGTNAVIIAHSANLREAAGLWPKPEGVAYVFRPLQAGRFEVLAKIAPQDWVKAARLD